MDGQKFSKSASRFQDLSQMLAAVWPKCTNLSKILSAGGICELYRILYISARSIQLKAFNKCKQVYTVSHLITRITMV